MGMAAVTLAFEPPARTRKTEQTWRRSQETRLITDDQGGRAPLTKEGGPPVPPTRPHSVTPPPLRGEDERSLQLRRMKRRATGLLLVMAGAFVAVTFAGSKGWLGYAQAGIQASLVGGLADWFAVTALFRHPLGLPIPPTAIIRERKDDL